MYVQHKNVEKYFFEEVLLSEMSIYDEPEIRLLFIPCYTIQLSSR